MAIEVGKIIVVIVSCPPAFYIPFPFPASVAFLYSFFPIFLSGFMAVGLTKTKKGRLIAWPVKKVLPSGTLQLRGAPDSRKFRRAQAAKLKTQRNNARIKELEESIARRGK